MKSAKEKTRVLGKKEFLHYLNLFSQKFDVSGPEFQIYRDATDTKLSRFGGILVEREFSKRAQVTTANADGFSAQPGNIKIDRMLFPEEILYKPLGCLIDEGNIQNFEYPIETIAPAAAFVEEGGTGGVEPEYDDKVSATPKEIVVAIDISKRFFDAFTSKKGELFDRRMTTARDKKIDDAMLNGTGINGEPEGLFYNDDVSVEDGSSLSKAKLDSIEKLIDDAEAPAEGRFYLLNPADAKILKSRPIITGGDKMLIEGKLLNGEPFISTPKVTQGHLFYGHWSAVMISFFWEMEIFLKRQARTGNVVATLFDAVDIIVRRPDWIAVYENID